MCLQKFEIVHSGAVGSVMLHQPNAVRLTVMQNRSYIFFRFVGLTRNVAIRTLCFFLLRGFVFLFNICGGDGDKNSLSIFIYFYILATLVLVIS